MEFLLIGVVVAVLAVILLGTAWLKSRRWARWETRYAGASPDAVCAYRQHPHPELKPKSIVRLYALSTVCALLALVLMGVA